MATHTITRTTLPPACGDEHIFEPDHRRRCMVCLDCGRRVRPTAWQRRELGW